MNEPEKPEREVPLSPKKQGEAIDPLLKDLLIKALEENPQSLQQLLETLPGERTLGLFFRGPLPPPAMLQEYDRVVPGLAERIIRQFERQSEHRQEMERRYLTHLLKRDWVVLGIVGLLGVAAIGGSIYLLAIGKSVEGLLTFAGTLSTLLFSYIRGSEQAAQERREKREMLKRLDRPLDTPPPPRVD
ncbi:MAG: DUF2335 domain-containing protein [Thermus sp.]